MLSKFPISPGVIVKARPVGLLRRVDGGETDNEIICVPGDSVDSSFAPVQKLEDIPKAERDRMEKFFQIYKSLPQGRKKVVLKGVGLN